MMNCNIKTKGINCLGWALIVALLTMLFILLFSCEKKHCQCTTLQIIEQDTLSVTYDIECEDYEKLNNTRDTFKIESGPDIIYMTICNR